MSFLSKYRGCRTGARKKFGKNKFIGFGTTEARLRLHEIKEKRNSPGAALEYGYWAGTGTEKTVY